MRKATAPAVTGALAVLTGIAIYTYAADPAPDEPRTAGQHRADPAGSAADGTAARAADAGRVPTAADVARADRALAAAGLPPRGDWRPVLTRLEEHDGRPVTVVRFQEQGTRATANGPHLTVVLDEEDVLLGYTRLAPAADGSGSPPGGREAREAAGRFMSALDPAYAAGLSVDWVDRHDEEVTTADGTRAVVSGTKVKSHHEDGLYSWVVVGAGGQVVTYERDIRWDSAEGRRGTEMWLHDSWITAYDGEGPQPAPPYAVA
jgi:hypothetical protein